MLRNLISSFLTQDDEFEEIWQIKSIKFRVKYERKYYETILGKSQMVYDTKGNPEIKGVFIITNLRIMWHAPGHNYLSISIGLDTIHQIASKQFFICNNRAFLLIIKVVMKQGRYEFKFIGFSLQQLQLFDKSVEIFKQITATKHIRNIAISTNKVQPCEIEQIKSRYENCFLQFNNQVLEVTVTLTNARIIVIMKQASFESNYAIPWISIASLSKTERQYGKAVKIQPRSLSNMYLGSRNQGIIMQNQIMSFGEIYSKHPFIGIQKNHLNSSVAQPELVFTQVQQIKESNFSMINNNSKLYGNEKHIGSIQNTFYCEQLGVMMQKIPQGLERKDLWSIFNYDK